MRLLALRPRQGDRRLASEAGMRSMPGVQQDDGTPTRPIVGEREVFYAWHPWAGHAVRIHEAIEKATGDGARCSVTSNGRLLEFAGMDVRSRLVSGG